VRILVTGATGFVGRWLTLELESAGHEVVAAPPSAELDLGSSPDLAPLVRSADPDAVVHLAAISSNAEAEADSARAWRVNVGGTEALFAGLDSAASKAGVLVASTSEVYGSPDPDELPITEATPLQARRTYGKSKVEQENVALRARARGRSVLITRAFNHIGPGQRDVFVVPSLARRALALRDGLAEAIPAGNLDVRRDFTDVRDVVRAYRLLVEQWERHEPRPDLPIFNVATGSSTSIREVAETICRLIGIKPRFEVAIEHVRLDDAQDIRGDAGALAAWTGWHPTIPLATSLADVIASLEPGGS